MNSTKRAVIYHRPGANANDRIVYDYNGRQTIIVGVADDSEVENLAVKLVEEGVQIIELCGGMGITWQARVIKAIDGKIPVGAVLFGIESLISVADYNARFNANQGPFYEVFLTVHKGADPTIDRHVISDDMGRTTFIGVPNEAAAEKVAADLAGSDVQLIELYGDITPEGAAKVIEASGNGKIPVGVNAFSLS